MKYNKVYACVHYYDVKGREYRLGCLAEELKSLGIEVADIGFEDFNDGYVNILVTLKQAYMLDEKYGSDFQINGRGKSIEEKFTHAMKIREMVDNMLNKC